MFLADQVKDYVMFHVRLFAKLRFTRKQDLSSTFQIKTFIAACHVSNKKVVRIVLGTSFVACVVNHDILKIFDVSAYVTPKHRDSAKYFDGPFFFFAFLNIYLAVMSRARVGN